MSRFKQALHKKMRPLCTVVGPGDGQDHRYDKEERGSVQNRKALQLASQVFETLATVIPNMNDEVLQNLTVDSVLLHPDSSQMLVTVVPETFEPETDEQQILLSLEGAKGKLRSEVSHSIHRRKTPNLVFKVKRQRAW
jgi:ribosome-binding factor A